MNIHLNTEMKKLLKENPEYKSIFKTLLGSFKSKKPEDYKSLVMSPGVVRIFNSIIDKINDKIANRDEDDNLSFSSYLDTIHHKTLNDLDIKNAPEEVQKANIPDEVIKNKVNQALSFAEFKKQDEKEEDDKKEKKAIKSIEDMIKDLQKDVNKIKSDIKDTKEKAEDAEDAAKDAAEESKKDDTPEKEEKKDEKSPEKEEDKNDNPDTGDSDTDEKESEESGEEDKKDEKEEKDNPLGQL